MSAGLIAVASLVVAFAAFVQGSTGFGFALIVAPVVGIFEPALLPVLLLVLMIPLMAISTGGAEDSELLVPFETASALAGVRDVHQLPADSHAGAFPVGVVTRSRRASRV